MNIENLPYDQTYGYGRAYMTITEHIVVEACCDVCVMAKGE